MRSSKSRSRNKSNRQRTLGNVVNRVFDSSGPEGKVRGTPQQIIDKYLTLARDAQLSNDRVAEQSFLQHAEHYTRMLGEAQREQAERQGQNQQGYQRQNGDDDRDGGNGNGNGHNHGRNGQQGQQQPYGGGYQARGEQPAQPRSEDGPADAPRRGDEAERGELPRFLTQPRAQETAPKSQPQSQNDALPDAVAANEDHDSGLVETPETQPKPRRSRAPRVEGAAAAPRRRKPKTEAEAEAAPATIPAASTDPS